MDGAELSAPVDAAVAAPVTVADFELRAREVLPKATLDYYDGGADDEVTLRQNVSAFSRLPLYYRVFRGVADRETSTTVLGHDVAMPILVAPLALMGMARPNADVLAARAASAAGSIFVLSTLSMTPVEEVVRAAGGPVWFQLYVYRDRAATEDLVRRVETAGCTALEVTADAPILGTRERDLRNAFRLPADVWAPNFLADAGPAPSDAPSSELAARFAAMIDPGLTWDDLAWLRSITSLPIVVKGIVRADDARRSVEAGAAAVVVSNHGGRQLDTSPASLDALSAIADVVGNDVAVLLDGGVRRGTDVVKALALGARAVQIGRPVLWGVAVDGEGGVARVLHLLHKELSLAMALAGCRSIPEITRDLVRLGADGGSR